MCVPNVSVQIMPGWWEHSFPEHHRKGLSKPSSSQVYQLEYKSRLSTFPLGGRLSNDDMLATINMFLYITAGHQHTFIMRLQILNLFFQLCRISPIIVSFTECNISAASIWNQDMYGRPNSGDIPVSGLIYPSNDAGITSLVLTHDLSSAIGGGIIIHNYLDREVDLLRKKTI